MLNFNRFAAVSAQSDLTRGRAANHSTLQGGGVASDIAAVSH